MDEGGADRGAPRPPALADLVQLARRLNERGARYCVVGGMAMAHHGSTRLTKDIDLLVAAEEDNVRRVRDALLHLPDRAAAELAATDLQEYGVVRVADEILIDLMAKACGLTLDDLSGRIEHVDYDGVPIPFASPEALLATKGTVRPIDAADRLFLTDLIATRGRGPG